MKKNKIIGIAVATLGVVFSFSAAAALYQKAAEDVDFGISAGTYAGSTSTAHYTINGSTGNASAVNPVYCDESGDPVANVIGYNDVATQAKYEFALGAEFANDVAEQEYVMGKISVSISNLPAAYNGKVQIYASVNGYTAGTVGGNTFGAALINDVTLDGEHESAQGTSVISVKADGSQHKLVVWVKLINMAGYDYLGQNEDSLGYTLSVTWTDLDSDYDACAYIIGSGNQWTVDDEYRMAVDPTLNKWTYRYDGLQGSATWTECKAVKTTTKGGTISKYSGGDNFALANGTTYTLLWNEEDSGNLYIPS